MSLHIVGYNSQRDNKTFGKFSGAKQCFSTCAYMLLSFYVKKINANNDTLLALYFDDVEKDVGKVGIAEKLLSKYKWIKGSTSFWYFIQRDGLNKWLKEYESKKRVVYKEKVSINQLISLVDKQPCIIGTRKIGGIRGGHMILILGYDRDRNVFFANDPYGNAKTNYKKTNGEQVEYNYAYLKKHFTGYVIY